MQIKVHAPVVPQHALLQGRRNCTRHKTASLTLLLDRHVWCACNCWCSSAALPIVIAALCSHSIDPACKQTSLSSLGCLCCTTAAAVQKRAFYIPISVERYALYSDTQTASLKTCFLFSECAPACTL